MKSVFLLDFDDTCYDGFSPVELVHNEKKNGLISEAELNIYMKDLTDYKAGISTYEEMAKNYIDHCVATLKNKRREDFVENARQFFKKNVNKVYDFVPEIVKKYQKTHDFYFVSSGFDYSMEVLTEMFNFTGYRCNVVNVENGIFQASLKSAMYNTKDKERQAKSVVDNYLFKNSVGFGDSISDSGIMKVCETGFCVNASDDLRNMAKEYDWRLVEPNSVLDNLEDLFR